MRRIRQEPEARREGGWKNGGLSVRISLPFGRSNGLDSRDDAFENGLPICKPSLPILIAAPDAGWRLQLVHEIVPFCKGRVRQIEELFCLLENQPLNVGDLNSIARGAWPPLPAQRLCKAESSLVVGTGAVPVQRKPVAPLIGSANVPVISYYIGDLFYF